MLNYCPYATRRNCSFVLILLCVQKSQKTFKRRHCPVIKLKKTEKRTRFSIKSIDGVILKQLENKVYLYIIDFNYDVTVTINYIDVYQGLFLYDRKSTLISVLG